MSLRKSKPVLLCSQSLDRSALDSAETAAATSLARLSDVQTDEGRIAGNRHRIVAGATSAIEPETGSFSV
jgi:hypothetical protein